MRPSTSGSPSTTNRFNSRTPCGVRPFTPQLRGFFVRVSIHAPRAGCDPNISSHTNRIRVSIHAPRAGCDGILITISSSKTGFNSRTPCGVRLLNQHLRRSRMVFQFTHPVRGATSVHEHPKAQHRSFNSRTPCGVRLRCSKVRINRGLDDNPLRTVDSTIKCN